MPEMASNFPATSKPCGRAGRPVPIPLRCAWSGLLPNRPRFGLKSSTGLRNSIRSPASSASSSMPSREADHGMFEPNPQQLRSPRHIGSTKAAVHDHSTPQSAGREDAIGYVIASRSPLAGSLKRSANGHAHAAPRCSASWRETQAGDRYRAQGRREPPPTRPARHGLRQVRRREARDTRLAMSPQICDGIILPELPRPRYANAEFRSRLTIGDGEGGSCRLARRFLDHFRIAVDCKKIGARRAIRMRRFCSHWRNALLESVNRPANSSCVMPSLT